MSLLCRLKNLVHKGLLKKEDLDRIVIIPKEQENKVIKMREATPEERESISKYINNISNPTVVNFWDLDPKLCEDCISRKSAILEIQRYGVGCFYADDFNPEQAERFVISRLNGLPSIQPVTPKLQMVQNPCVECGCNYCTNDDCENRYIIDIAESEGITEDKEYEKDLSESKEQILKEGNTLVSKRDLLERFIKIDNEYEHRPWNLLQILANINILIGTESCDDTISRQAVLKLQYRIDDSATLSTRDIVNVEDIESLSSVTPKPKIGQCKDCKQWRDSDGTYRRGIGAESQCPINSKKVFEGNGYCYMFEPKENEVIK